MSVKCLEMHDCFAKSQVSKSGSWVLEMLNSWYLNEGFQEMLTEVHMKLNADINIVKIFGADTG